MGWLLVSKLEVPNIYRHHICIIFTLEVSNIYRYHICISWYWPYYSLLLSKPRLIQDQSLPAFVSSQAEENWIWEIWVFSLHWWILVVQIKHFYYFLLVLLFFCYHALFTFNSQFGSNSWESQHSRYPNLDSFRERRPQKGHYSYISTCRPLLGVTWPELVRQKLLTFLSDSSHPASIAIQKLRVWSWCKSQRITE